MNDKEKAIAEKLLAEIEAAEVSERQTLVSQYETFLRAVELRQAIEREPR